MDKSNEPAALLMKSDHSEPTDTEIGDVAEIGQTGLMRRRFSSLSLVAAGFSLTNSWFGLSTALVTGINAGGPVLLVHGLILVGIISVAVAISLAELASAYPDPGGQYTWAKKLAPPRLKKLTSYVTGWISYAGAIFTSASIALSMAQSLVGLYQLWYPDLKIKSWHVVVAYQIFNFIAYFFNTWGKIIPAIASISFYVTLSSFITILVAVPASTSTHNSAKYVFTQFINTTGWDNNGMVFILGLINASWPYIGLDSAVHLADEVTSPETAIPKTIISTVILGFCTAWGFVISMLFSIQDIARVTQTPTLVPIIEIFDQALGRAGAAALDSLILMTGMGCQIACHTWQGRVCWSFARDRGLPGHTWLRQVSKGLDVPLIAHTVSCLLNAVIGLLYLASSVALNSVITASMTLLYISYAVPVICLLIRGRKNASHGPFWLGRVGFAANWILLCWTIFSLVFFSLPFYRPATASNMNYVSGVYFLIAMIIGSDWLFRARHCYGAEGTHEGHGAQ